MNNKLSGPELVKLKQRVVNNFNASNWRELGALTDMMDEVERHPRLLRSLGFGDDDYEGLALKFLRSMVGEDYENLKIVKNYIDDICPENGENVSSIQENKRAIIFNPNIFQIPENGVADNLISVMMPFNLEMSPVYEAIKDATSRAGLKCKRADDIWDNSTVIQDVFSLIFQSYIVVCDFSGKNPNVFYEAGIAHTLGKHVVPITQSDQDIPFDLKHHRYAKYHNNGEGLQKLTETLISRFKTLAGPNVPSWL